MERPPQCIEAEDAKDVTGSGAGLAGTA